MSVLNCLIVEDEVLAATVIADYVAQVPGLALKGICEDAFSATEKLREEPIDLIFLDINLPKMNGLEFIRSITGRHHIILTTAYHQYAVDGFNLDVIDYLLKPVTFERFLKAVNKARDYHDLLNRSQESGSSTLTYFFVKTNGGLEKVSFSEILFVEALQNYIIIHTDTRRVVTYSTLKNVESFLPVSRFLKVQKSFVVALDRIDRIDGSQIMIGSHAISISRTNKEEVLTAILANNILKR